jgi:hypothetical protein
VPVIGLFEYFYLAQGGLVGFDPEFPVSPQVPFTMHARNAVNFANIQTVDRAMPPPAGSATRSPQASTPSFTSAMTASAPTR